MADATALPSQSELKSFQWSNPTSPRPELARALATTDTTVYFSAAPKDKADAVITDPFLMGVKVTTGVNRGYTMLVYCPNGADGASGLSATGAIVGVAHDGSDYTTVDSGSAVDAPAGSAIFCADTAVLESLKVQAIQGSIATGGNDLKVGDNAAGNKKLTAANADANQPFLQYNDTANQWEFSNDGVSTAAISASGTAITGGDGISVTAGDIDVDLTDTTVFVQTSSGAGDDGKVVRLESDGYFDLAFCGTTETLTAAKLDNLIDGSNADALHTHTAPAITAVTAEAIDGSSTPQAVSIMGDNYKDMLSIAPSGQDLFVLTSGSKTDFGEQDTNTQRAQSFVETDALASTISLESLYLAIEKVGSPTDDLTVEIQTDDSGKPSGTVVTNGTSDTVSGSGLLSFTQTKEFTWSTPPELTSGTTYWAVVKRSTANNGSNYYQMLTAGGDVYASGESAVYTASTMSWTTSTTDFQALFRFKKDYDGDVAKSDANDISRGGFIGFTESNVAGGANATIVTDAFQQGFSGLTTGASYYVSTTAGAVTDSPSYSDSFGSITPLIKIGRALKADTLEVRPEFIASLDDFSFQLNESGSGGTTNTLNVPIICGFRPREVTIRYVRLNVGGTAGDDYVVQKQEIAGTEYNVHTLDVPTYPSLGSTTNIVQYTTIDDGISVDSYYDNGILLTLKEEHEDEDIQGIQIILKA